MDMPYQAEHHAFPNVSFHQLPQVYKVAQQHRESISEGCGAFTSDYLKSLD
jgi:fatty acid desaturase